MNEGFPRLYEDGTITICRSVHGHRRPKNKAGVSLGKKKKSFELTSRKKRLIRCSAIRQFLQAKRKILFCTLTFPGKVSQQYANECFSKYVDNLNINYNLLSYVAVKENHKSGVPHFHCLFEIAYIPFNVLNRVWCNTFSSRFNYSPNAFTTGKRKFAEDVKQIAHYITKYISKAEGTEEDVFFQRLIETRIYFISRNVLSNPAIISENDLIYLTTRFKSTCFVTDHYTIYFLKDFADLPEKYLIPKRKKPKKKVKIPDYIQPNLNFSLSFS